MGQVAGLTKQVNQCRFPLSTAVRILSSKYHIRVTRIPDIWQLGWPNKFNQWVPFEYCHKNLKFKISHQSYKNFSYMGQLAGMAKQVQSVGSL